MHAWTVKLFLTCCSWVKFAEVPRGVFLSKFAFSVDLFAVFSIGVTRPATEVWVHPREKRQTSTKTLYSCFIFLTSLLRFDFSDKQNIYGVEWSTIACYELSKNFLCTLKHTHAHDSYRMKLEVQVLKEIVWEYDYF